MMTRYSSKPPINFPSLTGYLLGAGAIAWLVTGWWTPLVVSMASVAILRRALHDLG